MGAGGGLVDSFDACRLTQERQHMRSVSISIWHLAVSSALLSTAACAALNEESPALGTTAENLYVLSTTIWSKPNIDVCWDTAGASTEKGWVHDAIRRTWEKETNALFTG